MGQDVHVLVARAHALTPIASTSGIERMQAFATDRAVIVRARAEAGVESGWHTHGDREVFGYLIEGSARFEYGRRDQKTDDIAPGDFIHVPAGLVHRDINPDPDNPQEWVLVFVGGGPVVVNVENP